MNLYHGFGLLHRKESVEESVEELKDILSTYGIYKVKHMDINEIRKTKNKRRKMSYHLCQSSIPKTPNITSMKPPHLICK